MRPRPCDGPRDRDNVIDLARRREARAILRMLEAMTRSR